MTRRKPPPSESGTFTLSTTSGGVRFSPGRCEAWIGQRYITLADQECRLLRALVEDRGQVVTRTALMLATWGTASRERIVLLENVIDRLRERLGPDVTIETVTGIGYRLI